MLTKIFDCIKKQQTQNMPFKIQHHSRKDGKIDISADFFDNCSRNDRTGFELQVPGEFEILYM
jgi:hypothetical protein